MTKIVLIIIMSTICSNLVFGQIVSKDIEKANYTYANADMYSFNIAYKIYKDKYSKIPLDTKTGYLKKYNSQQVVKIANITSIYLKDAYIVIDEKSKKMIINKSQTITNDLYKSLNIDSLLKNNIESKYLGENNGDNSYSFTLNSKASDKIEYVEINFNKKTNLVSKMSYIFRHSSKYNEYDKSEKALKKRLDIEFTNISLKPRIRNSEFQKSYYVKKIGDKFIGQGIYTNYSIINNLN